MLQQSYTFRLKSNETHNNMINNKKKKKKNTII